MNINNQIKNNNIIEIEGDARITGKEPISDLVNNRYSTFKINHLWCVDFTRIGFFWLFFILDAATRRIIAFQLKKGSKDYNECTFNAKECICFLNEVFIKEARPDIIHSDGGGQFKPNAFKKFLIKNGVKPSMVDKKLYKFGNQIIERFFRFFH